MLGSLCRAANAPLFAILFLIPTTLYAQGKPAAPAVPGFTRFFSDEKADASQAGQLLLSELHCNRCHAAPVAEKEQRTAPILDGVGTRVKRSYLAQFLNDPHGTKPGTVMPNLFAGMDAEEKKAKIEPLAAYLASTGTPTTIRPDRKGISVGRDLYHKVGCVACHGTRDAKGDPETVFPTSIPLGHLKDKYTLAGLKSFLENPHQTRPQGKMPGILNAKEASDVANYLLQGALVGLSSTNMKYSYYEGNWKSLPDFAKLKPKATGEAADFELSVVKRKNNWAVRFEGFLQIDLDGNYNFHTLSDDGSKLWVDDKLVVNNDGIHPPQSKSGKIQLAKGVHKVVVGMFDGGGGSELSVEFDGPKTPRQNLGPRITLTDAPGKGAPVVKGDGENAPLDPMLVAKGKEIFASMGCANCHQLNNEKKRIDATAALKLKAEGGCLSAAPVKGTPWYGLSDLQRKALTSALKAGQPAAKAEPAEVVKATMIRFNCYACHDRDKIGGVETDLNKHFQTVMPEMGDEGRIPPSLTGVGAKLKPAYLKKILNEGSHDRPYMYTRMPKFGDANVGHLVSLYGDLDVAPKAPKVALPDPINKAKFAARHMVGPQAFGCVKCHTFAGVKAEGVQGIDLAIMTQRLNHDWFYNYMLNPSKYRPGTRMPAAFPDGKTLLKNLLDGTADTQIEAIWVYLSDGKAATLPVGTNKASIPLLPSDEAILYRNFIQGAGSRAIGVGYPEKAHIAFDANDIRLALIWQGAFMDARRHWTDRGVGFEPPMGDNVMQLHSGAPFFILAKPDEAWPALKAKEIGYRFKGYRLTDDQRPTFLYSFNEIQIEDTPNAITTKASPAIQRTLAITTANPIDKLYYRAAVADKIEADKEGWYRINDWRMRIESSAPPVIRVSGTKMELLVPIQFKGNNAKIVQEYVW